MPPTCKKILCVDDDPDDRHFLSAAVHKADPTYEVIEAHNGIEALEYLNGFKNSQDQLPCLIVLDINMPMMDGKQTLVKIKADPLLSHLPVVMFSTTSNPLDKELFKRQGVELVTKPRDIATMSVAISQLLLHCA
jgi:CheY-like chemotaxis protein